MVGRVASGQRCCQPVNADPLGGADGTGPSEFWGTGTSARTEEKTTGFKLAEGEWRSVDFKSATIYVISRASDGKYKWEVRESGDEHPRMGCEEDFDEHGYLRCEVGIGDLYMNKKNITS